MSNLIEMLEAERDNVRGLTSGYTKVRTDVFNHVIELIKKQQTQSVKVWISVDEWKFDPVNQADIWFVEPPTMHDGIYDATGGYGIKYEIAGKLGLKLGECKPFLITEAANEQ